MKKVNQLNFVMHLYSGNARVCRIECNFLIPGAIRRILNHFILLGGETPTIYTSFEIEYQGKIIFRDTIPLTSALMN